MSDNILRIMFYDEVRGWVVDTVEKENSTESGDAVSLSDNELPTPYAQA